MGSSIIIWIFTVLLIVTSLFMILLVLIQRGRGGGLAGAFGGMGGQSAFGTRAGDVFTKITVVVAIVFILLSALLGVSMRANHAANDTGAFEAAGGSDADAPGTTTDGDLEAGLDDSSDPAGGATDETPGADASDTTAGDAEAPEGIDGETTVEEASTPDDSDEDPSEETSEGNSAESAE